MKHPRTVALIAAAFVFYLLASAGSAGVAFSLGPVAVAGVALWATLLPFWRPSDQAEGSFRLVAWMGSLLGLCLAGWLSRLVHGLLGELIVAATLPPLGVLAFRLALVAPDTPPRLVRHLFAEQPARVLGALAAALGLFAALPPLWMFGRSWIAPQWMASAPLGFFLAACVVAGGLRAFRRRLGSSTRAMSENLWPLLGSLLSLVLLLAGLTGEAAGWARSDTILVMVALAAAIFQLGHLWLVTESRALVASPWSRELFASACAMGGATLLFVGADLLSDDAAAKRWALPALCVVAFLALRDWLRRLAALLLAPQRGALLEALTRIHEDVPGAASYSDLAGRLLRPLRRASDSPEAAPALFSFAPASEVRLDAAGNPRVGERALPGVVLRHLREYVGEPLVSDDLHARLVRRPELRELVTALKELDALCVLPLLAHAEVEGALVVARGARVDPITLEEIGALEKLLAFLAPLAGQFLAAERAQRRADEAGQQRDETQERFDDAREELAQLRAEANLFKAGKAPGPRPAPEVQYSPAYRELTEHLIAIAPQETPVLLIAEHGLALTPAAELLLRAGGREGRALVVGDCAGLALEDQAAALFGLRSQEDVRPGWLELAAGGVLLLSDVTALSLEVQQLLAEALSEKRGRPVGGAGAFELTARVVMSARQPLPVLSSVGALAPELARWVERASYRVPALRDRREDLESLLMLAVDRAARVLGCPVPGIEPDALKKLTEYAFPGNLVELESVVERAVLSCQGPRITIEDLPPLPEGGTNAGSFLDQEREILRRALELAGGNKTRAARALGLKRTTLIDKMRRLGLEPNEPRGTEH